jgi:hypothetical protein
MKNLLRLIVLHMALILPVVSNAQARDLYTVENVQIGATGSNATEARNVAIEAGELKALTQLLSKLSTAPSKPLPAITSATLSAAVQGFELSEEKIASNRYQALLTVTFNPGIVRSILSKAGIPFSEASAIRTLIIPVYKENGTVLLWEPDNRWKDSISSALAASKNTRFILPLGDLEDMAALEKETLSTPDNTKLKALLTKYSADTLLIATAIYDAENSLVHLSQSLPESGQVTDKEITAQEDSSLPALLDLAAKELIPQPKPAPAVTPVAASSHIEVIIPFNDLKEWNSIKAALEKNSAIEKLTVRSVSINEALVTLRYQGNNASLSSALAQRGFSLHKRGSDTILSVTH